MTLGDTRTNDLRTLAIAFFACLFCAFAQAADLSGVPRVVDGDTLAIGTAKVRLDGIDAPETDQVCLNAAGIRWTCGIDARDELAAHIGGQATKCTSNGTDAYKRTLAICSLKDEDLNVWMVQQGWALAYVRCSSRYLKVEQEARANQRGLWQGAFIASWDWRHRNTKTVVLGAFAVHVGEASVLETAESGSIAIRTAAATPALN